MNLASRCPRLLRSAGRPFPRSPMRALRTRNFMAVGRGAFTRSLRWDRRESCFPARVPSAFRHASSESPRARTNSRTNPRRQYCRCTPGALNRGTCRQPHSRCERCVQGIPFVFEVRVIADRLAHLIGQTDVVDHLLDLSDVAVIGWEELMKPIIELRPPSHGAHFASMAAAVT